MKRWIFLFTFGIALPLHAGIRNPKPGTPDQTWQNDLDLDAQAKIQKTNLNNTISSFTTTIAGIIPSGSKLLFFQSACPSGYTQDASLNGYSLRLVSGTGGASAGSDDISTVSFGHSHTVNSHTHSISHRHYTPLAENGAARYIPNQQSDWGDGSTSLTVTVIGVAVGGGAASLTVPFLKTGDTDTANSGAATPGTDTQLSAIALKYANVIVCTKN